jgi:CheY-like chemotaxis protein
MSLQVLLVDDDDMVIYLHKTLLEMSSLSVPVCFGEGKAALTYLHEQYQPGDTYLVLLDVNMPVLDGWQFLDAIQDKPFAAALKVIMVTSSIDNTDREKAFRYQQVIDFVEKPISLEYCKQIRLMPQLAHL